MANKAIEYYVLQEGRENAIPAKRLMEMLGYRTKRELQREIEKERVSGLVILSSFSGSGYYRSNDPEELRKFTRTMNAKAKNTLKALESAERALDEATGQERMDGWW